MKKKTALSNSLLPVLMLAVSLSLTILPAFSQNIDTLSPSEIKKLSVEDLMNIEVTSVSKRPEKLTEAPSAIQVITREDILRSAAKNVPEALRLASNLQVAQVNSRHWVIGSRGFNNIYANKLLVLIDGRTVYSPLFAGVFWDAQNLMLEDVERIEIISGPGGTLWGANAVNGIINIITRNAKDSKGIYASAGVGQNLKQLAEARYGGKIGSDVAYRIYTKHIKRNNTILQNGQNNTDDWEHNQAGFAMDWEASDKDALSFQGNFYMAEDKNPNPSSIDGQHILGRWSHAYSDQSNLVVQAYVDRNWRIDAPSTIRDQLITTDLEVQHNFPAGKSHQILWGGGYRYMKDEARFTTDFVGLLPAHKKMHLFSSFIQDDITIIPERLVTTVGTKLQHNTYSGFEWQPSARVSYTPFTNQLIWAAVSRAVRTPSRMDVDYFLPKYPVPPTSPSVAGGPNFTSEKLVAYELGYRTQPYSGLSLSVSTFYNVYDDLHSVEVLPGTLTYQIQNGSKGTSYGVELSGNYVLTSNWSLRGGYTFFHKNLKNKPGNVSSPALLGNLGTDADNMATLQSVLNLPKSFQFDVVARYMDYLPATLYNKRVTSYVALDTRIGWQFRKQLELSVTGQNLLKDQHLEFGNGARIERGVFGRITWRY
ncbi:MAG TPA: TonB-dependent receptor [Sphingobacteriaceae bacterium]